MLLKHPQGGRSLPFADAPTEESPVHAHPPPRVGGRTAKAKGVWEYERLTKWLAVRNSPRSARTGHLECPALTHRDPIHSHFGHESIGTRETHAKRRPRKPPVLLVACATPYLSLPSM